MELVIRKNSYPINIIKTEWQSPSRSNLLPQMDGQLVITEFPTGDSELVL